MKRKPEPGSILREADGLIAGPRARAYGYWRVNWARTARLFRELSGHDLSVAEALAFMACVKLARLANGYARDSAVDAAAYLELYSREMEGRP